MSETIDDPAWIAYLLGLETELSKDLPDESEVVSRIAKAIRKHCAGLCDPRRPLGRYLLIGPAEPARRLAAALARTMFHDDRKVLKLDMGEYAEKYQVSGLYGHNGGLVCDYVDGSLTGPIRHDPKRVVLLENVEKAHPDARQLLVEAFEEGKVVDYLEGTISIKASIFIMTTLVGYSESVPRPPLIVENEGRRVYSRIPDTTTTAIQRVFPPEMLEGTFIDELLMIGWGDDPVRTEVEFES